MQRSQKSTLWGELALVGLPVTGQPDAAMHRALGLTEAS
jgi:hypothetical protein